MLNAFLALGVTRSKQLDSLKGVRAHSEFVTTDRKQMKNLVSATQAKSGENSLPEQILWDQSGTANLGENSPGVGIAECVNTDLGYVIFPPNGIMYQSFSYKELPP